MGAEEKAYQEAVRSIPHPRGTPAFAAAKQELWEQYRAGVFQRDGMLDIIYRFQGLFAIEYYAAVEAFYNGELNENQYRQQRIKVLRDYADRLKKVGLATAGFNTAWVSDFAEASLQYERQLLPAPPATPSWSTEAAQLLCDPLREFSKQFFYDVHAEFGIGQLKDTPDIYGGVDAACREGEQP